MQVLQEQKHAKGRIRSFSHTPTTPARQDGLDQVKSDGRSIDGLRYLRVSKYLDP